MDNLTAIEAAASENQRGKKEKAGFAWSRQRSIV
jgi:hypothetical protein